VPWQNNSRKGDFSAFFRSHWLGRGLRRLFALNANRSWVFALFFWRRLAILNLARRDIDNELGEPGRVAGAFDAFRVIAISDSS